MQRFFPRPLVTCLLVALLLRLVFIFLVFPPLQQRWNLRDDGDNYGAIAQTIRNGNYSDVMRGPVYPVFLAVAGSPTIAKIAQALLDTMTCALIFFLAGRRWWAAALWAIYPFAIWRVAFINKEIVLTFLLAAYVLAQLSAIEKGKLWQWLVAGALLGVVNLCKPMFLLFPLVVIGALIFRALRDNKRDDGRISATKQVALQSVSLVAAVFAMVAPWTLRNYQVTRGEFLPIATEQGGVTTFIGNFQPSSGLWEGEGKMLWTAAVEEIRRQHPDASVVELDRIYYRAAFEQIASSPLVALKLFVLKCGRFWFLSAARREFLASVVIQLLYLTAAAIGLWKIKSMQHGRGLMLAMTGYVMLVHAFAYADIRFSLIVMPFVCALAVSRSHRDDAEKET